MGLGPFEIGLVVLIILALFGAGRIPAIMGNLGKGIHNFKKGLKDDPS